MRTPLLKVSSRLLLAVLAALVLMFAASCGESAPSEEDTGEDLKGGPLDSRLIGKWRSIPQENGEGYNIGETSFEYQDGRSPGVWDFSYKGTIRYVRRFNDTDGVIIIEYTANGWPRYTESGHNVSAWVGTPIPGPFFAVYYYELSGDTVRFANSTTLDSKPPYKPPETATLNEAITKFTLANRSRFVASVAMPQQRWSGTGK